MDLLEIEDRLEALASQAWREGSMPLADDVSKLRDEVAKARDERYATMDLVIENSSELIESLKDLRSQAKDIRSKLATKAAAETPAPTPPAEPGSPCVVRIVSRRASNILNAVTASGRHITVHDLSPCSSPLCMGHKFIAHKIDGNWTIDTVSR